MSRLTQILRGKKIKPLTEMEAAVKYAVDHAGSGINIDWEQGSIEGSTGIPFDNLNQIRTTVLPAGIKSATCDNRYHFAVFAYDGDNYVGHWNGTDFSKTGNSLFVTTFSFEDYADYRFRITLTYADSYTTPISPSAGKNVTFTQAGSGGGGDSEPFTVHLTLISMDDQTMIGTATFDKTVAEIAAAHEKGREVYAVLDTSEEKDGHMERSVYRIPLTAVSYIDGTPRGASFSMTQMVSENANMVYSGMLAADNPTGTITVKALN